MTSGWPTGLQNADGRRPRVAVVGGTPASAMVARTLVEHFGCAPLAAATGEEALALIRGDDGIDLVLFDLALPDMDGIVAVQLIRALGWRGAMPIVAIGDSDKTAMRGHAAGFAASVRKPYSPRELYGAMQNALSRAAAARVLS